MRTGFRQFVSVVAVLAIALHTVLWPAVAPTATGTPVDPFSVICRSAASGPGDATPAHGAFTPAHACDHCNLCSAAAPPAPQTALAVRFEFARILQILRPTNIARHDDAAANPKLARGPPAFA